MATMSTDTTVFYVGWIHIEKLPEGIQTVAKLTHLQDIIDASIDYCISYKPNISFFEAYGIEGLKALEKVIQHINHRPCNY